MTLLNASPDLKRTLRRFADLPRLERFHVWARAFSCPMDAVAAHVPHGAVLDLGCGHGLFSALLAQHPKRQVRGIDLDERKIRWARRLESEGLTFAASPLEAEPRGHYDAVTVLDVLYLVPRPQWPALLAACAERLKPGGRLVLKEVAREPTLKYAKTWAQEVVQVRALGRTLGASLGFASREEMRSLLEQAGYRVEVFDLSPGYSSPHVLYRAERPR